MEQEEDKPPVSQVSVNQIVAWNIAWYRHKAGLTQEELGKLLGWSKNKVSEAERSWTGKRTREFDAQILIALSLALGVPLNAFFLPPLNDGKDACYVFRPPGADRDYGMADLMNAVVAGSEEITKVMEAYRERFLYATGEYLDEGWQEEIAAWLRPLTGPEALEEGAFRLRGQRDQLLATAAWLGDMADALEKVREEEGQVESYKR